MPRQTGRSDLCSRHQHGSAGHSAWWVIRVTQLCRISQVCRQLARDAELVALASTHTPSDLRLMTTVWMQRALGHATSACLCQPASQRFHCAFPTACRKWCCVELFVCICVLPGDELSARARRGAVMRHDCGENDDWCVRTLSVYEKTRLPTQVCSTGVHSADPAGLDRPGSLLTAWTPRALVATGSAPGSWLRAGD